jgi:diacylglycerol kinase family enzyme
MPDRNVPLALLPTGTANNVAHSLDLLGEAEEIAANLQGAPTRPFDLGSVKGPCGECSFIEAVGQ